MIGANDGGVDVSNDGGETWSRPALPIGQFYHVAVDNRDAVPRGRRAAGHRHGRRGRATRLSWPRHHTTPTGTTSAAARPAGWSPIPATRTSSTPASISGIITRYDHRTGRRATSAPGRTTRPARRPRTCATASSGPRPSHISPHDPKAVYHGANVLFRTPDGGQSWDAISPDLTRNDKSKQQWSGGPITGDNTGVETYCTIFAVAESPKRKGPDLGGQRRRPRPRHARRRRQELEERDGERPRHPRVGHGEHDRAVALRRRHGLRRRRRPPARRHAARISGRPRTTARPGSASTAAAPGRLPPRRCARTRRGKGMLYLGTERGVAVSRDDGATWSRCS